MCVCDIDKEQTLNNHEKRGYNSKNRDIVDSAMTSFNKHHLTLYWVYQHLKANKGQIHFWTGVQSAEIMQPLRNLYFECLSRTSFGL